MRLQQLLTTALAVVSVSAASAQWSASDDFNGSGGISYGYNGGSGFGPLTYIEGINGGVFASNPSPLNGTRSLGVFPGSGGGNAQAAGRTFNGNQAVGATLTFDVRFNLNNSVGFSGVNLRNTASLTGSTFGTGELLSIGLVPSSGNNVLAITGSTLQTLDLPVVTDLRGQNLTVSVTFSTLGARPYTVTASVIGNPATQASISGFLQSPAGAAAALSIGVANFNTGTNQDLIVDNIVIPEPSTVALVAGLATFAAVALWRRRQA